MLTQVTHVTDSATSSFAPLPETRFKSLSLLLRPLNQPRQLLLLLLLLLLRRLPLPLPLAQLQHLLRQLLLPLRQLRDEAWHRSTYVCTRVARITDANKWTRVLL